MREICAGLRQCYGCILWLVRRVCRALCTQCTTHTPYRVSPILYLFYPVLFLSFWIIISIFHTYPLLQSQYAAIALTKPCISFTHLLLTKRITPSQVLTLAPRRWFPCRPKHVGAFLFILECFNNSTFLTLCASVGNKKCSTYSYFRE